MVYLPLIVVVAQRYQKDAGIGTVVSLMLPYVVVLSVLWTLFFVVWYLLGSRSARARPSSSEPRRLDDANLRRDAR